MIARRKLLLSSAAAATLLPAADALSAGGCPAGPTPPAQASAAGYKTLVFSDDFTTNTTIATTSTATSGFKWYWSSSVGSFITSASWSVNTAGSGILALNSVRGSNNNFWGNSTLITLPRGVTSVPAGTAWQYAYYEVYAQLPSTLSSPTGLQANGYPALWAWSAEGASTFGGNWPSLTATPTEIDFMEAEANVFGWSASGGHQEANIFYPGGVTNVYDVNLTPALTDNNWHKWGFLTTNGSPAAGFAANTCYFYFDDVQKGSHVMTATSLSTTHHFLILGTGINWPMNVDWVHVWQ